MTQSTYWHEEEAFTLIRGDCVKAMKRLPDNSQDSVVTDPPYGIQFMGKAWDGQRITEQMDQNNANGGHDGRGAKEAGRYNLTPKAMIAFQEFTCAWAREAFRVLKPGGHLVSFCSTRTYHRMAAGVEDAGFEIRDQLAWVYGSGFPKSLDVAKAIDACDKIGTVRARSLRFTEFMRTTGLTGRQINEATSSSMSSHYLTAKEQPEVATEEMFSKLRPLIAANRVTIPADIEELVAWRTVESENMKRRKVLRTETMVDLTKSRPVSLAAQGLESAGKREVNITAAHTEAAKKWEGWGTALKPAWEPIVLARKPLDGTVADNVLTHGTGALNVDGCRIGTGTGKGTGTYQPNGKNGVYGAGLGGGEWDNRKGRWPANLCHDGSPGVLEHFPNDSDDESGDAGSAARFFYCAKGSSTDRDEGLGEEFRLGMPGNAISRAAQINGEEETNGRGSHSGPRRNIHPTVKPTELMRWLARLVTPPRGRVLDPFNGSGSTGKACMLEGFHYTGIDLDEEGEYLPIAKARIQYALEHKDRWEQIHAAPAPTPDVEGQITFAL